LTWQNEFINIFMNMEDDKYPINETQKKGLEYVGRALNKKFKFIKGIELYENYEDYENLLFINVIMDYTEFAKTYNYYTKKLTYGKIRTRTISSYVSKDEESWFGPTDEKLYEEISLIRYNIEKTIDAYYNSLPQEYRAMYTSSWGDIYPRGLSVSEYVDVD
jgi:hypothetical protein